MHTRTKYLTLISATLIFCLNAPVSIGRTLETSVVQAQATKSQNREIEAQMLVKTALEQVNKGELQAALKSLEQALAIYKEIGNIAAVGKITASIGEVHTRLGQYSKALDFYQQALVITQQINDSDTQVQLLAAIAVIYNEQNEYVRVIEFAEQGLKVAREINSKEAETAFLLVLLPAYTATNQADKVIEPAHTLLALGRENKSPDTEGLASILLGVAYNAQGDYQKAVEFSEQGLKLAPQIKQPNVEALGLITLASAYESLDEDKKAVEFAQAGLKIAQELKNSEMQALALVTLGNAYNSLGEAKKAIDFATQSLEIARKVQDVATEIRAVAALGDAYKSLEEYEKAIEVYQQVLKIARDNKIRILESAALIGIGDSYDSLNEEQKAIDLTQQGLAIAREIKDTDLEHTALFTLSNIYIEIGDYSKVIDFIQRNLIIAKDSKNRLAEGLNLTLLGLAYFGEGDDKKTIDLANQGLSIAKEIKSPISESLALLVLGFAHSGLGKYQKAVDFTQQSLVITKELKIDDFATTQLNALGGLYRKLGQKDKAIVAYQEALSIDESDYSPLAGLGRVYRELNMPITAITYYKEAISGIEEYRGKIRGLPRELQETFLKAIQDVDRTKTSDIYRELADLLLSQGRILEAQQVLELLKLEELRDYTGNKRAGGEKQDLALNQIEERILKEHGSLIAFGEKLAQCQQSSCNQLSQLLSERKILTERFNQTVQGLEKEVSDRRANDRASLDLEDLGRKSKEIVDAQPGTILIYPFVVGDKIWLLWASKGGVLKSVEVPKVGERQLGEMVLKFRQLLDTPTSAEAEVKATAKQLYDVLIKPLEPELKANQIQNLVFSLDRSTRYIPMSALFDGQKYLIENYTISTVLSADLTDTKDRLPPGIEQTSILGLGLSNAVSGFNALPNVPAELDAIIKKKPNDAQGVYPGQEYLNADFNLNTLSEKLAGNKLLHIATHGEFVPGIQANSYLLLGDGQKLPVPEIKNLQDLGDVHLVVLSACQTALSDPGQDGKEINGISYYFLNGGAKAVMASLWQVDDASTRELMQFFYNNLAKSTADKPMTKSAALQQAQLSLMQAGKVGENDDARGIEVQQRPGSRAATNGRVNSAYSHPYYWAPFILIGNGL